MVLEVNARLDCISLLQSVSLQQLVTEAWSDSMNKLTLVSLSLFYKDTQSSIEYVLSALQW